MASDETWADILVTQPEGFGTEWRKRQQLVAGAFPFATVAVERPAGWPSTEPGDSR